MLIMGSKKLSKLKKICKFYQVKYAELRVSGWAIVFRAGKKDCQ